MAKNLSRRMVLLKENHWEGAITFEAKDIDWFQIGPDERDLFATL